MSDEPPVLVLHTVAAARWTDCDAIERELERQLHGVEFEVARTPSESVSMIADAKVVLAPYLSDEVLAAATDLEWIQALSSGVDFFDRKTLAERSIALTNASGVHPEPIAEQVFGYLLAFERRILDGILQQRRATWERYEGGEIRGKTLGIVGLGEIGTRVAEYGQRFGMTVVGTKRDPGTPPDPVDGVYGPDDLFEVLRQADYLVVSCPLTDDTRGMIGSREIGIMKSDAVLVNVARGEIVHEGELTRALQQSRIRGAALDVFEEEPLPADSPLWRLSNVIVTPHMAGTSPYKPERLVELFANNHEAYRDGGVDDLLNRVV